MSRELFLSLCCHCPQVYGGYDALGVVGQLMEQGTLLPTFGRKIGGMRGM